MRDSRSRPPSRPLPGRAPAGRPPVARPAPLVDPVLVAEIGAAHGVRGELRVKPHTGDAEAIADYGPLVAEDGRRFVIERMRPAKAMLVVSFAGITDRNAAEPLVGTRLYVERSALPEPDEDEFYHADLIGLAVETTAGEPFGRVAALHDFGAGDLIEVMRPGAPSVFLPFTRAVVPVIDIAGKRIVVEPPAGLLGSSPDDAEAQAAAAGEDGDEPPPGA